MVPGLFGEGRVYFVNQEVGNLQLGHCVNISEM